MGNRLHNIPLSDIVWSFNDNSGPRLALDTPGYRSTIYIDPFPCYSCNFDLVAREIEYVESKIPLPFLPHYYILPYETSTRTNGWADTNSIYVDGTDEKGNPKTEPRPCIVFSGKRIPIAPSMVRYLVAHEYGHIVHANLAHKMGLSWDDFAKMYATQVRKIPYNKEYGGLKWHTNSGEIIANDIRVTILNREVEFWPHETSNPVENQEIRDWWTSKFKEYFV